MNDSNSNRALPERLQAIVEDFQWAEGREKLELLLDVAQRFPALPERFAQQQDAFDSVPECMTPVFVTAELQAGGLNYYFDVPAESPTVRGFAALLAEGLAGAQPEEVLAVPGDFYRLMGLEKALTHQRLNGLSAILAHMKRLAAANLDSGGAAPGSPRRP